MTVIAGIASNHGKKGIVIGSDRAVCKGNPELASWLKEYENDEIFSLSDFLHFLKKKQRLTKLK